MGCGLRSHMSQAASLLLDCCVAAWLVLSGRWLCCWLSRAAGWVFAVWAGWLLGRWLCCRSVYTANPGVVGSRPQPLGAGSGWLFASLGASLGARVSVCVSVRVLCAGWLGGCLAGRWLPWFGWVVVVVLPGVWGWLLGSVGAGSLGWVCCRACVRVCGVVLPASSLPRPRADLRGARGPPEETEEDGKVRIGG